MHVNIEIINNDNGKKVDKDSEPKWERKCLKTLMGDGWITDSKWSREWFEFQKNKNVLRKIMKRPVWK